jgi:hypothetical protein
MICFDEIKVFLQFNYSLPWVNSFEKKCVKSVVHYVFVFSVQFLLKETTSF